MDDSLSTFAKAIRQRPHLLETKEDVDQLRRKLLTTQFKDISQVYPFISDDYKAVEFRAPGVLESYQVDPEYLKDVTSRAKFDSSQPVFADFVEKVQPPQGKELFAFFSRHKRANLEALSEEMMKNDDVLEGKRVFNAIRDYSTTHPEENKQIGLLIASMTWPDLDEYVDEQLSSIEEVEMEETFVDRSVPETKKVELTVSDPVEWDEPKYHQDETIKNYKLHAGIGGRFPSKKVATQILVSKLAPQADLSSLVGKHQHQFPEVDPEPHFYDDMVDSYSSETIASMVATNQAQQLYYALVEKPTDGRVLIKTLLNPTSVEKVHKRYNKSQELSSEIVESMIKSVV